MKTLREFLNSGSIITQIQEGAAKNEDLTKYTIKTLNKMKDDRLKAFNDFVELVDAEIKRRQTKRGYKPVDRYRNSSISMDPGRDRQSSSPHG